MGLAIGGILKRARFWCFKTSSILVLELKTWLKDLPRVNQYQTCHISLTLSLSPRHNIFLHIVSYSHFFKLTIHPQIHLSDIKKISSPTQVGLQNRESLPLVPTIPRRRRPKPKFESPDRPSSWDPHAESRFEDNAWGIRQRRFKNWDDICLISATVVTHIRLTHVLQWFPETNVTYSIHVYTWMGLFSQGPVDWTQKKGPVIRWWVTQWTAPKSRSLCPPTQFPWLAESWMNRTPKLLSHTINLNLTWLK